MEVAGVGAFEAVVAEEVEVEEVTHIVGWKGNEREGCWEMRAAGGGVGRNIGGAMRVVIYISGRR